MKILNKIKEIVYPFYVGFLMIPLFIIGIAYFLILIVIGGREWKTLDEKILGDNTNTE